jgi:hypothetical protein
MPLRLTVGIARKLGLPKFSSIGASCNLELELPEGLLHTDLGAFQRQVRDAYVACHQAVHDELARLQSQPEVPIATLCAPVDNHDRQDPPGDGAGHRNGSGSRASDAPARMGGSSGRAARPATSNQIKALRAIARTQRADLEGLILDEHGVDRPEDLTLDQASALIDQLKAIGAR